MGTPDDDRVRPTTPEDPARAKTATVKITKITERAQLYRHEPGQFGRQEVRMHLDIPTATLGARFVPYGDEDTIPLSVYHGRGVLWMIPCLAAEAANDMLEDVAPLCKRIIDGTEIDWSGTNRIGTRNDDAEAAIGEIIKIVDRYDDPELIITEYSASEWYDDGPDAAREATGITADTTDEQLTKIIGEETDEALSANAIVPDMSEYLASLRDAARDCQRDEPTMTD